jgi:hypothetical protein
MAEAIHYALAEWTELNVFCSDGAVPIDNNVSEREMKRVVLNRKNSLFVGNPRRTHGRHLGQPDLDLSQTRHRPATVSHPVADQITFSTYQRTHCLAARSVEANLSFTLLSL